MSIIQDYINGLQNSIRILESRIDNLMKQERYDEVEDLLDQIEKIQNVIDELND